MADDPLSAYAAAGVDVAAGDRLRVKATAGRTLDPTTNCHVYVWWKG